MGRAATAGARGIQTCHAPGWTHRLLQLRSGFVLCTLRIISYRPTSRRGSLLPSGSLGSTATSAESSRTCSRLQASSTCTWMSYQEPSAALVETESAAGTGRFSSTAPCLLPPKYSALRLLHATSPGAQSNVVATRGLCLLHVVLRRRSSFFSTTIGLTDPGIANMSIKRRAQGRAACVPLGLRLAGRKTPGSTHILTDRDRLDTADRGYSVETFWSGTAKRAPRARV